MYAIQKGVGMERIVGIDPGKSGAIAVICFGILTEVIPFKKDINKCRGCIAPDNFCGLTTYFVEKVTASPQMGVVSAFTFGRWAEAIETSLWHAKVDYHMVRPQKWQMGIGCYSGGDKQKLYEHAQKLFPEQYKNKMFNKSSADAVLIAYYGYRFMANS